MQNSSGYLLPTSIPRGTRRLVILVFLYSLWLKPALHNPFVALCGVWYNLLMVWLGGSGCILRPLKVQQSRELYRWTNCMYRVKVLSG